MNGGTVQQASLQLKAWVAPLTDIGPLFDRARNWLLALQTAGRVGDCQSQPAELEATCGRRGLAQKSRSPGAIRSWRSCDKRRSTATSWRALTAEDLKDPRRPRSSAHRRKASRRDRHFEFVGNRFQAPHSRAPCAAPAKVREVAAERRPVAIMFAAISAIGLYAAGSSRLDPEEVLHAILERFFAIVRRHRRQLRLGTDRQAISATPRWRCSSASRGHAGDGWPARRARRRSRSSRPSPRQLASALWRARPSMSGSPMGRGRGEAGSGSERRREYTRRGRGGQSRRPGLLGQSAEADETLVITEEIWRVTSRFRVNYEAPRRDTI